MRFEKIVHFQEIYKNIKCVIFLFFNGFSSNSQGILNFYKNGLRAEIAINRDRIICI